MTKLAAGKVVDFHTNSGRERQKETPLKEILLPLSLPRKQSVIICMKYFCNFI